MEVVIPRQAAQRTPLLHQLGQRGEPALALGTADSSVACGSSEMTIHQVVLRTLLSCTPRLYLLLRNSPSSIA